MKRLSLYTAIALMLAGCTADAPDAPDVPQTGNERTYEMQFRFVTYPMSRANTGGVYTGVLPPARMLISAYYTDLLGNSKYYFTKKTPTILHDEIWTIEDYFWPLQGNMTLFNYWVPDVASSSTLTTTTLPDGTVLPMMTVDGKSLDGYHDFIYGVEDTLECPPGEPATILCYHGLSWLRLRLYAEVRDAGGVYSEEMSQELVDCITVNRLYIEKCSRRGSAVIMPGRPIEWSIPNDSYIRDQVYQASSSSSLFEWVEVSAGGTIADSQRPIPVYVGEAYAPYLGLYDRTDTNYLAYGLMIVPEPKTAIVMDYTFTYNNTSVRRTQRFDLCESGDWKPGSFYDYDIVFRNYSDKGVDFELIPTWGEPNYEATNMSFSNGAFGTFVIDINGSPNNWASQFVIDPMHDGGSAKGDDMDYKKGGTVL